jgi:hypothetical protein
MIALYEIHADDFYANQLLLVPRLCLPLSENLTLFASASDLGNCFSSNFEMSLL